MARKIFEKGDSITLPSSRAAAPVQAAAATRPRTAIGGMAQFVVDESKVRLELESLRAEHAKYEGAKPARRLDPRSIRPSPWANRHEASFLTPEFAHLRAEIENAGGNVQAIKVRPLAQAMAGQEGAARATGGSGVDPAGGVEPFNPPPEYEIVYGHRRHRACLELGLPVLAIVEEASEQELFVDMDRENRLRADLSPWEQGVMYAKALDKGLFASNARLAAAVGRDTGVIGKALALARLPSSVVEAFPTPLDIQYRWAKPLTDWLLCDPEAITQRARELKAARGKFSAREVFEFLTCERAFPAQALAHETAAPAAVTDEASRKISIGRRGKHMATLSTDSQGRPTIRFQAALVPESRLALVKLIEDFLARQP